MATEKIMNGYLTLGVEPEKKKLTGTISYNQRSTSTESFTQIKDQDCNIKKVKGVPVFLSSEVGKAV